MLCSVCVPGGICLVVVRCVRGRNSKSDAVCVVCMTVCLCVFVCECVWVSIYLLPVFDTKTAKFV